jgi:hypothetical protein
MDCTDRRKPSLNVSSVEQGEELVVSYFDHIMTGLGCTEPLKRRIDTGPPTVAVQPRASRLRISL